MKHDGGTEAVQLAPQVHVKTAVIVEVDFKGRARVPGEGVQAVGRLKEILSASEQVKRDARSAGWRLGQSGQRRGGFRHEQTLAFRLALDEGPTVPQRIAHAAYGLIPELKSQ